MSSQPTQPLSAASASPYDGTAAATVLIADADKDYRQLYSELFHSEGFQTFCAKDGAQAVAVLQKEHVDLALIDVMPSTDGIALYRRLKCAPESKRIPVLLVSDREKRQDALEIETGADLLLEKPIGKVELIAHARRLLEVQAFKDSLADIDRALLTLVEVVENKNPVTAGHAMRVCRTALALAVRIGLPREQREIVRRGALLHDVGKVGVPDEVLLKMAPLTSDEKLVLRSHTYLGERLCAPLPSMAPLLQIVRNHHERLDGSGYPDGIRGNEIFMATRIVSLADVFDGLTTPRPYREGFSEALAMHQIRREAEQGWWDAGLVDELAQMHALRRAPGRREMVPLRSNWTAKRGELYDFD